MRYSVLTLCLLALLYASSTEIFAVNIVVNQSGDAGDGSACSSICTLRGAVSAANNLSSNDTITFAAGITNITLNSQIQINDNGALSIIGAGANDLTIDGGAGTNRIFFVNSALVLIQGVTLSGGNGSGAAIFAAGGALNLEAVIVQNNVGDGENGAIVLDGGTNHRISNSTVSNNTGFRDCAAITARDMSLTIVNTTVSGNSTTASGAGTGAICFTGTATATFRGATISGNTANGANGAGGGGIYIDMGATVNLGNTIVASNSAANGPDLFRGGGIPRFTTSGGNLIGDNSGSATNPNSSTFPTGSPNANGDRVGTTGSVIDPRLAPLSNNGGATPTRALLSGSPALDAGVNALATETFDQRGTGFPRIVDGDGNGTAITDIGAFEWQMAQTAADVSVSGRITTAKGGGISRVNITMTGSNGETRTALSNPFGYYSFSDVPVGDTYIFSVSHKQYNFNQSTQVRLILAETNDVNFAADNAVSFRLSVDFFAPHQPSGWTATIFFTFAKLLKAEVH